MARRTIREYVGSLKGNKDQTAVAAGLQAWFYEVQREVWKTPADVKRKYANASLVGDRIVFNIKGNSYRLVVSVNYRRGIVYIKWIGSHADYDQIDVSKVRYGH